ncbi:hypothetical protein D3C80_779510 [compost metagenome]
MERNTDDMNRLSVADERPDALRHYGLGLDRTTFRPHADPAAMFDFLFRSQFFRNFHEEFRLKRRVHPVVLRPVVEMFGQTVGGRRIGELRRRTELFGVRLEHTGNRVAAHFSVEDVLDRAFERFHVCRERTVTHHAASEQTRNAFLVHYERADILRFRRRRNVGNVITRPLGTIPFEQLAGRIPRLAVDIRGCTVVERAAVQRPGEGPAQIGAGIVRIVVVTTTHIIALLVPAAGIDPAAGHGRAVVAKLREVDHLLAGSNQNLARIGRVHEIAQRAAVDLLRQLFRRRFVLVLISPRQVEDRIGESTAFLAIQFPHAQEDLGYDPAVVLGFARRRACLPVPLQPAARIGERSVFLGKAGRRQLEHFGVDGCGVHVVEVAVVFPEP